MAVNLEQENKDLQRQLDEARDSGKYWQGKSKKLQQENGRLMDGIKAAIKEGHESGSAAHMRIELEAALSATDEPSKGGE